MNAPVVGITGRRLPLARVEGVPEILRSADAELHLADYARGVAEAGGLPVQLSASTDPQVLARLDALVLSGGGDIDPTCYGRAPVDTDTDVDPARDARELALYAAAREHGLPVLAICRGMQVVNVAHGGSLVTDLPLGTGEPHASFTDPRDARVIRVQTVPGTRVAGFYGPRTRVNCLHHQAVERLGEGLRVAARAVDGVIEALELPGAAVVGVQWHPEMFAGVDPCFDWLVAAAAGREPVARLA